MRAARLFLYMFFAARFTSFMAASNGNSVDIKDMELRDDVEMVKQLSPYLYVVLLVDGIFCFYEMYESKFCKIVSLGLITLVVAYLGYSLFSGINNFIKNRMELILLDFIRAIFYLVYSVLDYFYYGTGLKEFYISRGVIY